MRRVTVVCVLASISCSVLEFAFVEFLGRTQLGCLYFSITSFVQGVMEVHLDGFLSFRRLLRWLLLPGDRVSKMIEFAADWYVVQTHRRPQYCFIKHLPSGASNGIEIEDCMVMEAEWALDGCLMIGG